MKIECKGCGGRLWLSDMQLSTGGCNVVCPRCSTTQYVDASMMDQQSLVPRWYYAVNDESVGPLSTQDLEFNFQNGQITPDTYVWCEGLLDWMSLGAVSELDYLQNPVSGYPTGNEESTRIADGVAGVSYASMGGGEETAAIDLDEIQRDSGGFSPFDSNNVSGGIMGMDGKAAREEESVFDMSSQQAPSTPANDMIGARSENSVLFSLSALQAVSAPAANTSASGAPSGGGAGFIDVKALAASSPTPRRRTTEAAPSQVSYAPMNTVMPLGTKKSNTPVIVLSIIGAVILAVFVVILVVTLNSGEKEQMQQANVGSAAVLAANDARIEAPKADSKAQDGKGLAAADADKDGKTAADDGKKADKDDEKTAEGEKDAAEGGKDAAEGGKDAAEGGKDAVEGGKDAVEGEKEAVEDKKEGGVDRDARPSAKKSRPEPRSAAKKPESEPAPAKKSEPKPAAKKPESKPDGGGKLTKDEVQAVIRSSFAQVRTCSRTSPKKGKMNVQFTIKGNGRVNGARVLSPEYQGTPTAACVLKVVNGLKFRETGSDTPITYPFSIQ